MKFLILGSKGQLGKEFVQTFNKLSFNFSDFDIDELDINDYLKTKQTIETIKPDIIINCSAYNDVDKAESVPELAMKTNALAVFNIAKLCEKYKIFLIHFSSDYVFSGNENYYKYTEFDDTNPINEYGKSKLLGEKYIAETTDKYLIFRVSWVYGNGTQNFLYKFLNWSKKNSILRITSDEISIPTSVSIIVKYTLEALSQGLFGIFHLTSSGFASRYDWALEIAKLFKIKNDIIKCSINEFNLPAKRPFFSAMDNNKLFRSLDVTPNDWKEDFYLFIRNNYYSY